LTVQNFNGMETEEEMVLGRQDRLRRIFIGESPAFQAALDCASLAFGNSFPVLISGETGVGKDELARYIHARGLNTAKEFLAVNCGALPENLIESELFGHEKGTFTGATGRKVGLFESVNGGTIYLDEMDELPLYLQVKLLRVIDTGMVRRVGNTRPISVSFRVIASVKQDIDKKLKTGKFRQDLYYRLAVIRINLCPLRERPEDIPLFVDYFLHKNGSSCVFSKRLLVALMSFSWPGNIRELENVVTRAILWANHYGVEIITQKHFMSWGVLDGDIPDGVVRKLGIAGRTLAELEKAAVLAAMEETENGVTRAAEILGVTPRTVRNMLNSMQRRMRSHRFHKESK